MQDRNLKDQIAHIPLGNWKTERCGREKRGDGNAENAGHVAHHVSCCVPLVSVLNVRDF